MKKKENNRNKQRKFEESKKKYNNGKFKDEGEGVVSLSNIAKTRDKKREIKKTKRRYFRNDK